MTAQRTYRFVVDGKPLNEEEKRRWLAANGFGMNFASLPDVAERAADACRSFRSASDEAKRALLDPWKDIDWVMRNNPLRTETISPEFHNPETKKAVLTLAPRIVQLVNERGWGSFRVVAEDALNRPRAERVQMGIRYFLEKAHWHQGCERRVIAGLCYGAIAVQTSWDIQHRVQTLRKARDEAKAVGVEMVIEVLPNQKVLSYEGLRWDLIDHRDLIWDPTCNMNGTQRSPMFCGRTMKVPLVELLRMEAAGTISGVVEAVEGGKGKAAGLLERSIDAMHNDQAKRERDGYATPEFASKMATLAPSSANPIECCEIWASWSSKERPTSADDWREWQFFYVNGHPVRIAHNPYDSQHKPIAACNLSSDPFSTWGTSLAMDAMPLQIVLDDLENLGRDSHRLAVSPFWSSNDDSQDAQINLRQLAPGSRIPGRDVQVHRWPSTIADTTVASAHTRAMIAGITGVPPGMAGMDDSGTATQYEGNMLEANRRGLGRVLAVAGLEMQIAQHCFFYMQQFITRSMSMKLFGRGATTVGLGPELRPEDLADPIDIAMVGLGQLSTHGVTSHRIAAFTSQAAPFINAAIAAGRIDPVAITEEIYQQTMGFPIDDQIIRREMTPEEALPPEIENAMLRAGAVIEPHPMDDHPAHAENHAQFLASLPEGDDQARRATMYHLRLTAQAWAKQQAQAQARAAGAMVGQQTPGIVENGGRRVAGGGRGADQADPTIADGVAASAPGVTPGPPNAARMAAPDRTQPVSQFT